MNRGNWTDVEQKDEHDKPWASSNFIDRIVMIQSNNIYKRVTML